MATPTLAQLKAQLDALEARIPHLLVEHPDPADFWPAFAGEADLIADNAGQLRELAEKRIQSMADNHGLRDDDVLSK